MPEDTKLRYLRAAFDANGLAHFYDSFSQTNCGLRICTKWETLMQTGHVPNDGSAPICFRCIVERAGRNA